jgi:hypothetical protein
MLNSVLPSKEARGIMINRSKYGPWAMILGASEGVGVAYSILQGNTLVPQAGARAWSVSGRSTSPRLLVPRRSACGLFLLSCVLMLLRSMNQSVDLFGR